MVQRFLFWKSDVAIWMGWCVVFSLELKMCFFIIKQAFISILGKKQLLACKKGCKFLVSSICIQSNYFKERLPIVSISWASHDPWYVYLCSLSYRSHFFKMFFKKDMTLKKDTLKKDICPGIIFRVVVKNSRIVPFTIILRTMSRVLLKSKDHGVTLAISDPKSNELIG